MRHVPHALSVGGAVFCGALLIAPAMPDTWYSAFFCRVPAWLAAAYYHAGYEGISLVLGSGRVVTVTRDCGGSDFFALICAVLTWHAVRQNGTALLPLWWAGAWLFTVSVNGMRVIASVWMRTLAEVFLPERFYGVVHLVSGVLVFFPALALLWWVCSRHDLSAHNET